MDTKKKSWIRRTRQGPKGKWNMDLVGTGSDEMYFQSFLNFWILLLLKCSCEEMEKAWLEAFLKPGEQEHLSLTR